MVVVPLLVMSQMLQMAGIVMVFFNNDVCVYLLMPYNSSP